LATAAQALTVREFIDQRPMSRFQIWTVAVCTFVLVLDGFDAQLINYTAPPMAETMHIPVNRFGPIFSASLIGLMLASMATGPIADRWGRKWPVIASVCSFAAFSLATAHVTGFSELWLLRFAAGLGLGGAMPNVVALASEYVPRRLLPILVPIVFVGMPLGGTTAGLASAAIIRHGGWQSMYYIGGALPLVISFFLIALLPESIQFLAEKGEAAPSIRKILARISRETPEPDFETISSSRARGRQGVPVVRLFTEGRTAGTILLWVPYFMNLLLIYFTGSWLPALLRGEGMTLAAASTATAFISFGGMFGCLAEGFLIKRGGPGGVLLLQYALAGLFLALLAEMSVPFYVMLVFTFTAGFMIIGAQGGLNALTASFYPTSIRSTGLGWALGVGRVGSIVGPLVGGVFLTSFHWKPSQMLLFGTFVAGLACVSIFAATFIRSSAAVYSRESSLDRVES